MLGTPCRPRAGRSGWQIALTLSFVASSALMASAQTLSPLQEAQQAYAASEFDGAAAKLNEALRTGTLAPADLALAHRLLGIVEVANGDDEGAMAEFALSLALDPTQPTPLELGPEQAALFDGIRAGRAPLGLDLTHSTVEPGGRFVLTARPRAAPAGLVHAYRVEASAPGLDPWSVESTTVEIEVQGAAWRGAAALNVRVRGVDEHGNLVVANELEVRMPPPPQDNALPTGPGPVASAPPRRSKVGLIIGIVAGVVLVGAAVGIGVWAAGRPVPTTIEVNGS